MFLYLGREFDYELTPDLVTGEPWKEQDGHGVVSDWTSRAKRPGELILAKDRTRYRYYDFAESTRIAIRDGWGPSLEGKTRRESARVAVLYDYQYLRGWCEDSWHWCVICMRMRGCSEPIYLGGVESSISGGDLQALLEGLACELALTPEAESLTASEDAAFEEVN
jgi:hypothetical protein